MACENCAKIRAAILHGKMAEAAGLTVEKLREAIGFKPNASVEVPAGAFATGGVVEPSKGDVSLVADSSPEAVVPAKRAKDK